MIEIYSGCRAAPVSVLPPEFQTKMKDYPSNLVASPRLFQKVAVARICVA